jgi:TnpA family transposase
MLNRLFRHGQAGTEALERHDAAVGIRLAQVESEEVKGGAMVARLALVGERFSHRPAALGEDRFVRWEAAPALRWVLQHDHGYRAFVHLLLAGQPQPDGTALVR